MTKTAEPESKNAVVKWLEGKKTYVAALAILTCGILRKYGIEVPDYVLAAIGAFGLYALRDAIRTAMTSK